MRKDEEVDGLGLLDGHGFRLSGWFLGRFSLLLEKGLGEVIDVVASAKPAFAEGGVLGAGGVEGPTGVAEVGEEVSFVSLRECCLEGLFCFATDEAIYGEGMSVVVEGVLEDFASVFVAAVEVVVTEEEFGGGVSVGADPDADCGGVVENILEAGLPGGFALS